MSEPRPDKMSGHLAWQSLSDAIRLGTQLQPFGAGGPFEGGNAGRPIQHRTYQIEPARKTYQGRMRGDESDPDETDIVLQQRLMLIRLRHDYSPGLHDACYQVADADAEAVEDALMVRDEATWLQPVLVSLDSRRDGGIITQTLTVQITYDRPLPPALE